MMVEKMITSMLISYFRKSGIRLSLVMVLVIAFITGGNGLAQTEKADTPNIIHRGARTNTASA